MQKALFEPLGHAPGEARLAKKYRPHESKFSQHVQYGSEDLVHGQK